MRNLGGHNLAAIRGAFAQIDDHRPTVLFAYTIKGTAWPANCTDVLERRLGSLPVIADFLPPVGYRGDHRSGLSDAVLRSGRGPDRAYRLGDSAGPRLAVAGQHPLRVNAFEVT
jgi:hypothetical protein